MSRFAYLNRLDEDVKDYNASFGDDTSPETLSLLKVGFVTHENGIWKFVDEKTYMNWISRAWDIEKCENKEESFNKYKDLMNEVCGVVSQNNKDGNAERRTHEFKHLKTAIEATREHVAAGYNISKCAYLLWIKYTWNEGSWQRKISDRNEREHEAFEVHVPIRVCQNFAGNLWSWGEKYGLLNQPEESKLSNLKSRLENFSIPYLLKLRKTINYHEKYRPFYEKLEELRHFSRP